MGRRKRRPKKSPKLRTGYSYGLRVDRDGGLTNRCQVITARGRRCSRPASIQLGDRAVCQQHAYS